jgi:flagellar biosynthesis protein FlhF
MRIKSYFADSVQEAIEKARVELGPDAMLMNSKKTDFELRALGSYEVVFGLPAPAAASKPRLQVKATTMPLNTAGGTLDESAPAAASGADGSPFVSVEVTQQLAELRRQIETVRRSMTRQQHTASGQGERTSRAAENLCARLMAADLSEELAQEVAEAVELQAFASRQSSARGIRDFEMTPSETLELALSAELDRRFQVAPELGQPRAKQKIGMFVGPAGAGKTTALIKLALRFGLQAGLPMQILSLDTLRVGGWEHLAAYARIAGLGFDAVHNLSSLAGLLDRHSDKKLILIDTPGFGPADTDDLQDLSHWLQQSNVIDTHLVLPATVRPAVASRILDRFSKLKPAKLLLTRADETESMGMLLDLAMRSGLPLSYISNGQTIPEDIEQPSKADLLARFTGRRTMPSRQEAAA